MVLLVVVVLPDSLLDLTVASCSSAVFLWYSFRCVSPSLYWRGMPLRLLEYWGRG